MYASRCSALSSLPRGRIMRKRRPKTRRVEEEELSTCSTTGKGSLMYDERKYPFAEHGSLHVRQLDLSDLQSVRLRSASFEFVESRADLSAGGGFCERIPFRVPAPRYPGQQRGFERRRCA
eukprot:1869923-Rhodomonas_salina.1